MLYATPSADFLDHLQTHWPFPTPLIGCTLVSAQFSESAVSPELFNTYSIPVPQAGLKRQAEFLAARLCAREALRLQTGQAKIPTQQAHNRAPLWPKHSCGSMSHSHNICAAIVGNSSHWQSLGLDIEKPIEVERAQRLAKTILTPDEHSVYNSFDSQQRALYLTLAFSLKESLFKALNPLTNCYFGFYDAQVLDLEPAHQGRVRLKLCKSLSEQWQAGCELQGQFAQLHGSAVTLVSIAS